MRRIILEVLFFILMIVLFRKAYFEKMVLKARLKKGHADGKVILISKFF